MKKVALLSLLVFAFVACDKNANTEIDPNNNAYLFEQVKLPSETDTTVIRFTIGIKGQSDATGMCYCYPLMDSTTAIPAKVFSHGTFMKLTTNPLKYYFMKSLNLYYKKNKTVNYFEAVPIEQDLYRVKVTFPDTTKQVGSVKTQVSDTLVYQATRKIVTVQF